MVLGRGRRRLYHRHRTRFFYQEEHPTVAKTTISPGSSKAMLILNNGEIISLSEKNKTEIVATEELSIRNEGSRLRYTASENTKNEQANNYNELIVPKVSFQVNFSGDIVEYDGIPYFTLRIQPY